MIEREIEIKAPVKKVFDVIRALKTYPEFIKGTDRVIEAVHEGQTEATFTVNLIKPISYTLRFQFDEPTSIRWDLVKGELMKKNSGSWTLTPLGSDRTKAEYKLDVGFGWLVPQTIVDQLTKTQLPEMLEAFKNRAEAL